MIEKTLIYGRQNTFLLSVTDNLLQIALRLTENDGPIANDYTILRVMILNQTVVKATQKTAASKGKEYKNNVTNLMNSL